MRTEAEILADMSKPQHLAVMARLQSDFVAWCEQEQTRALATVAVMMPEDEILRELARAPLPASESDCARGLAPIKRAQSYVRDCWEQEKSNPGSTGHAQDEWRTAWHTILSTLVG